MQRPKFPLHPEAAAGHRATQGQGYGVSPWGKPAELSHKELPCSGSSTDLERVLPPFPRTCYREKPPSPALVLFKLEKIEKRAKSVFPNSYRLRNVSDCIHVCEPWVMLYSWHAEKQSMTLAP